MIPDGRGGLDLSIDTKFAIENRFLVYENTIYISPTPNFGAFQNGALSSNFGQNDPHGTIFGNGNKSNPLRYIPRTIKNQVRKIPQVGAWEPYLPALLLACYLE